MSAAKAEPRNECFGLPSPHKLILNGMYVELIVEQCYADF
jgi:hypothetical protein